MSASLIECLLSGFAGAIAAQFLNIAWSEHTSSREFHAMLAGIVTECKYALSIVEEIRDGSVNGNRSFKRMPVDYFKAAREKSVRFHENERLLSALARVCVDLELYNLEVDTVLRSGNLNMTKTIEAACEGVKASLVHLKSIAQREYEGEIE